jgi:hypothetical protein
MSAIATIHLIPRSCVPELITDVETNSSSYSSLQRLGQEVATYSWSGYVIAALLPILQTNYGINLLSEQTIANRLSRATQSSTIVLTYADREASLGWTQQGSIRDS